MQYCNMMYMVISHVIETITGFWLGDFFRDNIWEPLNMYSTFFDLEDAQAAEPSMLAQGYFWDNKTEEYIPTPYSESPLLSGAGAIISSVEDYSKYLRAIMNKDPILSKESWRQLRRPRQILPDSASETSPFIGPVTYTLGWEYAIYHGVEIFFHGGSVEGFGTLMAYIPAKKWAVVIMTNADFGGNLLTQLLAFELGDRMLGIPKDERFPWGEIYDKSVQERLHVFRNGRKLVFPGAPTPENAIKHSLPLKDYTGIYWNAGYRFLNFTLIKPPPYLKDVIQPSNKHILHADVDRTVAHELDLEHVNGEHFLVRCHLTVNGTENYALLTRTTKGEFRIGSNGKVAEVGLGYEEEMGEDMIWFKKVG